MFNSNANVQDFIQSQNNLALHETKVSQGRIEWMIERLKELNTQISFVIPSDDMYFWGSYKPFKGIIEVNRLLIMTPWLLEQTLLHEFIHVLQHRGHFMPRVEYEQIHIDSIGVVEDYHWQRRSVERQMGGWSGKMEYDMLCTKIWLLEMVAMYMQTKFELFELWWQCEMT